MCRREGEQNWRGWCHYLLKGGHHGYTSSIGTTDYAMGVLETKFDNGWVYCGVCAGRGRDGGREGGREGEKRRKRGRKRGRGEEGGRKGRGREGGEGGRRGREGGRKGREEGEREEREGGEGEREGVRKRGREVERGKGREGEGGKRWCHDTRSTWSPTRCGWLVFCPGHTEEGVKTTVFALQQGAPEGGRDARREGGREGVWEGGRECGMQGGRECGREG